MYCSVRNTLNLIGKKWSMLIILELFKGGEKWKRYSKIKRSIAGITSRMLSRRLMELERDKLILKKISKKNNQKICYYSISDSGRGLIPLIKEMKDWSLKFRIDNTHCRKTDCKECVI